MSKSNGAPPRSEPAPPAEAFQDPLGMMLAEHSRQRQLCDRLHQLVMELDMESVATLAHELLEFLKSDLPRYTEDEERNLFPLLRQRCQPEDGIDEILDQLSEEHELDKDLVEFMIEDLEMIASGHSLPNQIRFIINVKEFAETQRRHLSWENRTVLPIAHRRLTAGDITELGRAMAERRGVDLGELGPDADG